MAGLYSRPILGRFVSCQVTHLSPLIFTYLPHAAEVATNQLELDEAEPIGRIEL
jgi:hypothetical protein